MVCRAPAAFVSNGGVPVTVGVAASEQFTLMINGDVHSQVGTVSQEVMSATVELLSRSMVA